MYCKYFLSVQHYLTYDWWQWWSFLTKVEIHWLWSPKQCLGPFRRSCLSLATLPVQLWCLMAHLAPAVISVVAFKVFYYNFFKTIYMHKNLIEICHKSLGTYQWIVLMYWLVYSSCIGQVIMTACDILLCINYHV